MGNDMMMDFKSKLGKFETSGKDNKKEASMDDAQNKTPVNVFPRSYILHIFLITNNAVSNIFIYFYAISSWKTK